VSQENLELVRGVTDAMDAEGFEAALPVFSRSRPRGRGMAGRSGLGGPRQGARSRGAAGV